MSLRGSLKHISQHALPGVAVIPSRQAEWWRSVPTFPFNGRWYTAFCHAHNCGWPPSRMTERAVELGLADRWLTQIDGPVTEVGAVTPYYWPGRVPRIVDPGDDHPLVTDRTSLFDVDFAQANVLCLSTLEHIGTGEYGQPKKDHRPVDALAHLTAACRSYLITVPFGWNHDVDAAIFTENPPLPAQFLVRSVKGNDWRECGAREARVPFQETERRNYRAWANGLAILSRGGGL
jgi:hypothetical protein